MWILFSFIASFFAAFYYLFTQNIKLKANTFMIYRGGAVVFFSLPVILIQPILFPLPFYLMAIFQGLVISYTDYCTFQVNKNFGAENVSAFVPFSVIITFIIWMLIDAATFNQYMQNPIKAISIFIILLLIVGMVFNLKKNKCIYKAFFYLIPVLFSIALVAILNKLVMNYGKENPFVCAFQRTLIASGIVFIIHFGIYLKKGNQIKEICNKKELFKTFIFLLLIGLMVAKNLAMFYSPNPAYVSCLLYSSILWIMILPYLFSCFQFKNKMAQKNKLQKIGLMLLIIIFIIVAKER